uniref:Ig-like domain-containing protein n=1 Tax=Heterorhabditis bacteriophora TaxID=37862 RepID=A0A1I7X975_HETBA
MKIKRCIFPTVLLLLIFIITVRSELRSQTFDLPSLIIHVDQSYLLRKVPRILSCQLSPGWSEAKLDTVYWIKDGEKLQVVMQKIGKEDYVIDGPSLTIIGGKQQNEGDYQCVADVSGVRLSNRQVVKTTLVSSPIKLRRARITKFDQTTNHCAICRLLYDTYAGSRYADEYDTLYHNMDVYGPYFIINIEYVKVREGEVARLPCAGLPDVVPGPAEICFEKNGVEGCFNEKVDSKYLSTATGLQIAFVQAEHAGEYHCIVKNEFTKQTRKSPRYVKLISTNSTDLLSLTAEPPQLVFPSKENKIDSPIVVDVVANQEVILECVFMNAKIIWTKHGGTTPQISLTDDDARIRQIWGNLRIRGVSQGDSGIYSCHGLSLFDDSSSINDNNHPRVYYSLVVHAPTDTHLELNQNFRDKSWQLSCLAKNLRYEIPMVYVNGTSLIDAIDHMGVASSTNFYTNPINATIRVRNNYSGSIQCISRPAMDEAEVYGAGLERGRSHNLYVISSSNPKANLITKGPENVTATVGEDVELICLVQKVNIKYWLKGLFFFFEKLKKGIYL